MSAFSPTPWELDDPGHVVDAKGEPVIIDGVAIPAGRVSRQAVANRELLLVAVNSHAALLAACEAALDYYMSRESPGYLGHWAGVPAQLRAAIAAAKPQENS